MDSAKEFSGKFTKGDYERYRLLIHKIAKKQYGISMGLGLGETYEDIFQNVVISFMLAKEKFDPDYGFKFSTYATSAAENNFISDVEKLKLKVCFHLEDIKGDDDEKSSWEELVADESESPIIIKERQREATSKIKSLSLLSKLVVRELISPSEELREAHGKKLAEMAEAEAEGRPIPRVNPDIDYSFIFQHYGINKVGRRKIMNELKKVFGV